MRVALLLSFLIVVCAVGAQEEGLTLAEPCDAEACQLPDCRCSTTDIPGGLEARDTPQFVLVTFDDGVNDINIKTYRRILYNRVNVNQCSAGATFFVNHEWNNYQLVNELYNHGFEIALHSVSHRDNMTYWQQATYEDMILEFGDQKMQMSHFANIPYKELKGVRIPYLQMAGNASFQVMADVGLVYDSTWGVYNGLWPYTLDYASTQDCWVPPCPTASIPGVWVSPMVAWLDLNGNACTMADYCLSAPSVTDADAWFEFILQNFERNYMSNRAPFGFYIHEVFLAAYPAVEVALVRFMNMINNMHDVFMVNEHDVIEWVKDPVPVNEYIQKPCRTFTPTNCPANNCGPLASDHAEWEFWMAICNVCPRVYPWLGNPLGL